MTYLTARSIQFRAILILKFMKLFHQNRFHEFRTKVDKKGGFLIVASNDLHD